MTPSSSSTPPEEKAPVVKPVRSIPARGMPEPDADRIGDILRRVRLHRGEDLEPIADYLRIRPSFLEALEGSHYEQLPADAYVIGFLRTYANYLGLDGKGAIDQYRREMAGRRRKPQLSMPQPVSESRAPTIAMIIGAVLAALLLYILWYGLSSSSRTAVPEPSLPAPVAAPASPSAAAVGSDAIASSVASTGVVEAPSVSSETTVPAVGAEGAAAKAEANAAPAVSTASVPAPSSGTAETAASSKEPLLPAKDEAEKNKSEGGGSLKQQAGQGEKVSQAETAAAETAASQVAPSKGMAYGAPSGRILIRADKESWILVTDTRGNTVFDKTLKPGDSYRVLDGKALLLTTGNAGGVVLSVDGADLPVLGAPQRVVRGIALDPDKLKSR